MKYLCVNLTKYVQVPYEENYKILMNEIKGELDKWKDVPHPGLEDPTWPRCQSFLTQTIDSLQPN
jgi:hypothetical protein